MVRTTARETSASALDSVQSWWMREAVETAHSSTHELLTRDLPEMFRLCAASLAAAPIPASLDGWLGLSRDDTLKLAPILGCVLLVCILPACALHERYSQWSALRVTLTGGGTASSASERAARRSLSWARRSYWLTRIALLRGMGGELFVCRVLLSLRGVL